MALYSRNAWTMLIHRKTKIHAHWILQGIGSILIISGIIIEFIYRWKRDRPHFEHIHEKLGLAALIFMLLAIILGVFAKFANDLHKILRPLLLKMLHNIVGTISFSLGMVGMSNSLLTKNTMKQEDPGNVRTLMSTFTIIVLFIALLGPLKTLTNQVKAFLNK